MLLLHHCVLYFKLQVTQQRTLSGAVASTSMLCRVTLPEGRTSFPADIPVSLPPSQTYCMMQSDKRVQGQRSPLFGKPLLWDTHHPPSALRQSLPECKGVFCLLSTHNLRSFSIQTCEIVPVDEVVICKLQAPSITSSTTQS